MQTPPLIVTGVMAGIMCRIPMSVKYRMRKGTENLTFTVIQDALDFQQLQRACEKIAHSVYCTASFPSRSHGHIGGWDGLGKYWWQTTYYIKSYPALQWLRHFTEPNLIRKSHSTIKMGSLPRAFSILTPINISRAWAACLPHYPKKSNCQWYS